ncbi:nucleoside hydrolase [Nocardia brasiliensis]
MADSALADDRVVVCDSDIFHDPDDAIMLIAAARTWKRLVVVTADEVITPDGADGLRARATRALLDALGRPDVPVIAGRGLGGYRMTLDYETLARLPEAPRIDLVDGLRAVFEETTEQVVWLGCGPATNLTALLSAAPHLAEQIELVQMGGWIDPVGYRDPSRASHNLRVDTVSAGIALRMCCTPRLVLSEHTGVEQIRVRPDWPLYQRLTGPQAPEWARLPGANFAIWCLTRDGSWMHDPLTYAAALRMFVSFQERRVRMASDGRLYLDPDGHLMQLSDTVDYDAFLSWLDAVTAADLAVAV